MRHLRFEHARRLVKLVGEAYELGPRTDACRVHLLGSIAALLGADGGVYSIDRIFSTRGTKPLPFVYGFRADGCCDDYRPAGFDDCLAVGLPDAHGSIHRIMLSRTWGAPAFTETERDALFLFLLECDALLQPSPVDTASLSPRLRQTLDRMLAGRSDKEIAVDLGLSVHTAREYAKAVLRALGMKSRVELIAWTLRPVSR